MHYSYFAFCQRFKYLGKRNMPDMILPNAHEFSGVLDANQLKQNINLLFTAGLKKLSRDQADYYCWSRELQALQQQDAI